MGAERAMAHRRPCSLERCSRFALSFDEVIVTTFTDGAQNTLPLWIFGAIRLGQQLPEVNVVVVAVLIFTVIPVYFAARLTGSGAVSRGSTAAELTAA